jgi:hypothetical protein
MEIAIDYGLHPSTLVLSDQSQLQLRRALVLRLRVLVPAFFVPTAVSGIALAVLDGAAPGLWFRCAGILAVLVWIVGRVFGTVPINRATLAWESGTPPKNWRDQVDPSERFHILGAWAAVMALVSFLTALALKLAAH